MKINLLNYLQEFAPDSLINGIQITEENKKIITTVLLDKSLPSLPASYSFYEFDFDGVDVISPQSAEFLITFLNNYRPNVLTNLSIHIQSLFELILTQREQAFWLCNQNSDPKILGKIDNKMLEILMLLIKTKIGTARSVAENIEHNTSKRAIGNTSVYLQSLFKQGLLMREKITALDCPQIQRGWTYEYYPCPIFWQLRK